jgi:cardiolipin synthase
MSTNPTHPTKVSMFDGLFTIPNAVTLIRLLCLPVFLWVLFGLDNQHAAAWLLGSIGATDWVDGFLARRLNQTSEFGKIFDPTVDRLLFFVGIVALIIDGSAPLWFALIVLIREILVAAMMLVATFVFKMERFDVTWWGKTAAFLLMFTFPGFLMGESGMPIASAFTVASWILGVPGIVLSVYTAGAYVPLVVQGVRNARRQT